MNWVTVAIVVYVFVALVSASVINAGLKSAGEVMVKHANMSNAIGPFLKRAPVEVPKPARPAVRIAAAILIGAVWPLPLADRAIRSLWR